MSPYNPTTRFIEFALAADGRSLYDYLLEFFLGSMGSATMGRGSSVVNDDGQDLGSEEYAEDYQSAPTKLMARVLNRVADITRSGTPSSATARTTPAAERDPSPGQ